MYMTTVFLDSITYFSFYYGDDILYNDMRIHCKYTVTEEKRPQF